MGADARSEENSQQCTLAIRLLRVVAPLGWCYQKRRTQRLGFIWGRLTSRRDYVS